ncbi:hypothetical protein K438DRAFT_1811469 [Mycena galopus ATCC 62051]|nr:hypothetical protein K438DRAFT_1811469 [Mycena galopus ATCC 62051]
MVGFNTLALALAIVILPALAQQTAFNSWADSDDSPPWTTFPHPISRVAVIGAGPSGLQAAAHLLAANLSVRLFERAPSPGGNWFYTEETPVREVYPETDSTTPESPPSEFPSTKYHEEGEGGLSLAERWTKHWRPRPVWLNMRTNTPAALTQLPGVQYAADKPWMLSVHDVERHVRAYASLHGLNVNDKPFSPPYLPITSYSTKVEAMQKCNDTSKWTLTLHRLQWLPESSRLQDDWWTEDFDAVVVASGQYTEAKVPRIKGIGNWSTAIENGQYSMYHSQSFRHPERLAGKTVLIVGASVSATQISRTIAPFAHRILASTRPNKYLDGYGLDILLNFGDKAEIIPEISSFEPLRGSDIGIKAGRIKLINGTMIEGIDEIILATGYHTNTFLPDLVNPETLDNLHWTGHYIHDPTLAYTLNLRPWTYGRYQSYALAKVWKGKARLPSRERMWRNYESGKYRFGGPYDMMPQEGLRRLFVAWLNSESLELGGQFVDPLPLETREISDYFYNTHFKERWLSPENWTAFENLPFSEWPKPGPSDLDYKVIAW